MKQMKLRLEDDLHARIKEAAGRERRTIHGQVIVLLELGLDSRDNPAVFEARVRRIEQAHAAAHAERRGEG